MNPRGWPDWLKLGIAAGGALALLPIGVACCAWLPPERHPWVAVPYVCAFAVLLVAMKRAD